MAITMKLEAIPLPVSDIDRAKAFYVDQIGFHADHDVTPSEGVRIVQLTPPGSGCSIVLGQGIGEFGEMTPGSHRGLTLVVEDIAIARDAMIGRGVSVGEIADMGGILFAAFGDVDGNTWLLQEIPPGR